MVDSIHFICKENHYSMSHKYIRRSILGIRQESVERDVDKMENSIQNIILQEMESLEGIMITTTNLTCNLDKATDDSVG